MTGARQRDNPGQKARANRLAAALRANIKRRKAQARARAEASNDASGASHDSAGIVRDSLGPKR
jgi:hypothetical protein